jgi:integrase
MENKILENLKNKNISDSSLKLYLNNLKRLNDNQEIKNFKFLSDEKKILEKIKNYKPNTQRSYIISIVSLLKEEPKYNKLYDTYYNLLMDYNKNLKTQNTKSEKQTENWITKEELDKIYSDLEESVKENVKGKKKLTEDEYNILLSYVVISLYTLQPPRRNSDYQYMVITKKYDEKLPTEYNYLDLTNNIFHFNNYKTNKTYQTQTIPISEELQKVIKLYISFDPLKTILKQKDAIAPFLLYYNCNPFESNNSITRILNKIFNKKIGSSMLRNMFLTDKFSPSVNELEEVVQQMGTSSNTALNNYIKTD